MSDIFEDIFGEMMGGGRRSGRSGGRERGADLRTSMEYAAMEVYAKPLLDVQSRQVTTISQTCCHDRCPQVFQAKFDHLRLSLSHVYDIRVILKKKLHFSLCR